MDILFVLFAVIVASARASMKTESCKDLIRGIMTTFGKTRIEPLRKELIKSNNAVKDLTKRFNTHLQTIKDQRSVVYTRWGKKRCPYNAEMVYSGFAGGSYYRNYGGAAEPICLPRDPEWGIYRDGIDGMKAFVFGAEYETHNYNYNFRGMHEHDVPCAVCLVRNRSVVKMFPARKTCYSGWKLEYQGYLMAGYANFQGASKYTCVDHHPDAVHGGRPNMNGKLFYFVEAVCGSLKCPPYVNGRELVCAVCSRK